MIDTTSGFARKLIAWQSRHGRHDLPWQGTRHPYPIWVSEIMLQQTQVGSVIGYFQRFMNRFPDVESLAGATEDEVLQLWSGLGYYARARNLRKAARVIVESYGGNFPRSAQSIEELPGVGRSTAAAIAAFAFGERVAILDGNVKRVLARRFGIEGYPGATAVEGRLWSLASSLIPNGRRKQSGIEAYTQGLMDLGATICTRRNPACGDCPVATDCIARRADRIAQVPAARPKRAHPIRRTTWLVLIHKGQVLLERRPSSGIWGGLWAFPELGGRDLAQYCLSEYGCVLSGQRRLPAFSHGFTHFRLAIEAVVCDVIERHKRAEAPGRLWSGVDEAGDAAVPTPVRKVLRVL